MLRRTGTGASLCNCWVRRQAAEYLESIAGEHDGARCSYERGPYGPAHFHPPAAGDEDRQVGCRRHRSNLSSSHRLRNTHAPAQVVLVLAILSGASGAERTTLRDSVARTNDWARRGIDGHWLITTTGFGCNSTHGCSRASLLSPSSRPSSNLKAAEDHQSPTARGEPTHPLSKAGRCHRPINTPSTHPHGPLHSTY